MELKTFARWLVADDGGAPPEDPRQIEWLRVVPYLGLHVACVAVIWVGVSATALAIAAGLYALRMFAITGFYHRYFSHRAFRTSRALQFVFAFIGASAVQRGPLWWVSHHRHHHAHADSDHDPHSARREGFFWSHTGWFMARESYAIRHRLVKDLARFPELRWLDRWEIVPPIALAAALYGLGTWLGSAAPELGTTGPQLLVWGFCVSTVILYHATFTINSLAHRLGRRRYATRDDSRNSGWLALLTFGEGWHNNHHHYPVSARQGFFWWEIDLTYYALRLLAALGLVWDLREVPAAVRDPGRNTSGARA